MIDKKVITIKGKHKPNRAIIINNKAKNWPKGGMKNSHHRKASECNTYTKYGGGFLEE